MRKALTWDEALAVLKEKHGEASPCYSKSFVASMPCPNWHLYDEDGGYIATVKWDGRIGYEGPQGRRDREEGRRIYS